jgi:hypothetical protein
MILMFFWLCDPSEVEIENLTLRVIHIRCRWHRFSFSHLTKMNNINTLTKPFGDGMAFIPAWSYVYSHEIP